jgi:cobalt-zinc-cadmium efflux system outer membrane protein
MALCGGVVGTASAQTTSSPNGSVSAAALRLGDLYREVVVASPRVEAARALVRASEARIPSAKLPPDPQLQLGFMNYSLPGLEQMDPLGMMQLQLMQMLPVAGQLGLSGRIASAQAAALAERATDVEWELRSDVAMAFYDLYQTDQSLAVARETLRLLVDIRRTAEAMYRVGEGRQADVLRAQVEIARMVEDTVRMTTMRTGMAARLNAILDRAGDANVGAPSIPSFPDSIPDLPALVMFANRGRPMIRAGEREVEAADVRTTLARRAIWPDLTMGVQYGQRGSAMGTERMGSLMIGASVPIFARSRQLRMREEAVAMRQMAAAELRATHADTRGRVIATYADLVRARNLAMLYRTTVIPLAQATVSSAHSAYRVGRVDFMTLLDDQMTLNAYRQELFALEAEQGKAWAELEMLVGHVLFDANVTSTVAGAAIEGDSR